MNLDVRYDLADGDQRHLASPYAETWFGEDRNGDGLDHVLVGTDAMVTLYDDDDRVAFRHAITDGAIVEYLRDLVVAEEHRRRASAADSSPSWSPIRHSRTSHALTRLPGVSGSLLRGVWVRGV